MWIERFAVQGYKNITAKVELTDLGAVNVIHGDNGVGKSNLLEAMTLLFRQLARVPDEVPESGIWSSPDEVDDFATTGIEELFTLGEKEEIFLRVSVRLTEDEPFSFHLVPSEGPSPILRIGLRLYREDGRVRKRYRLSQELGGDPKADVRVDAKEIRHRIWAFAGRFPGSPRTQPLRRFEMVNVLRQTLGDSPVSGRHLIPSELLLKLYDARESIDKRTYQRWELFKDTVSSLSDIIGPGEIVPLYDRTSGKANLALQRPEGRLPVHLLGSGAQQLIALIARIVLTEADFIGVEEPELNLRYTHQLRLRDVFRQLTQDPRGPRQLFITSHSPAFEVGDHFYAMTLGPDGPQISRSPSADAARFTQQDLVIPAVEGRAPLSYLTSEGLLQVPEDVRERIGLPGGGGVVMVDSTPGAVELMSNETWLQRAGLAEDEEQADDDG